MAPRWYTDSDVDEALRRVEALTKGTDDEIACKVLREEIERRLGERDRYKAALEAIVATDVPRIDEGDWMTEIAQEALDA